MPMTLKEFQAAHPPKDPETYRRAYEQAELSGQLAELVYDLRTQAGITQTELAKRVGTSQPAIARLESGGHNPNIALVDRVARALGARIRFTAEPNTTPMAG